jgi:uncharacterized membrane protein
MKKIFGFVNKISVSTVSFVLPILAFAATGTGPQPASQGSNTAPPSAGITSVQSILNTFCTVFDWAFYFLIALAVIFGVIAAFRYLTSSGNAEKIKTANSTLLYAAIAVAVALLARAIPLVVASFLGASSATGQTLGTC